MLCSVTRLLASIFWQGCLENITRAVLEELLAPSLNVSYMRLADSMQFMRTCRQDNVSLHTGVRRASSCTFLHLGILNALSVTKSCRLNFCWPSPAQLSLVSGIVEIYDQDFRSLLDMYVSRSAAFSSTREG
jgi:hypothetical protein